MTIIPEDFLEAFALEAFWADFSANLTITGNGKYTLGILTWEQAKDKQKSASVNSLGETTL